MKRNGLSDVPLYKVWCNMKDRCNNHHNKRFDHYGGRGIRVCEEWATSYQCFCEWATENGYKEGLSIDRIDNDKGYSPANCRWSTYTEQNRNRSFNKVITYKGKTQCVSAWAEEIGIKDATIRSRLKRGEPLELVLSQKLRNRWSSREVCAP